MKSYAKRLAIIAVFSLAATNRALAGLSYVAQSRSVEASSDFSGDHQARTADGFGSFDAAASFDFHEPPYSPAWASASQRSALGPDGVTAAGHVHAASGSPDAHYRSLVDVTFDVTKPTSYTLGAECGVDVSGLSDGFYLTDLFTVLLRRTDGGASTYLVEHRAKDVDLLYSSSAGTVSAAGVLAPGRYELTLDVQATIYEGSEDGPYSLKFAVGGGGGGPPNAVPLPPAAWIGLLTLGGLAGGQWAVARRRRLALDA